LVYLVLMGICVQIGQLYMTKALHAETTGKVMILQYLSVVYALVFGWGFFGETHGWLAVLGIALVVAGVFLNILYSKRQDAKTIAST
jgi:drug/metabolite transporter (DMT)-like permease